MNYVPPELHSAAEAPALIRVRGLTKSYGANRVLDGVSLDVRQGEVRCIIGPSGSGKSTLLRCLNALTEFDSGAVVLDETRVGYSERHGVLKPWTGREAAAFRSRVGLVSQHVNLFSHRNVLENVIEGPVQVLGTSPSRPSAPPPTCCRGSGWPTSTKAIPASCRAGSSSARQLRGHWR